MTDFLALLTLLGDGLLAWLIPALLWTGALLVLARAADELLSRRVSASWRIALYAVVLLRLALPAGWETPLGVLPGVEERAPLATTSRLTTAPAAAIPELPALPLVFPTPRIAWTAVLPLAWTLGTLAMLGWMLRSRRRLQRELRGARAARMSVAELAPGRRVLEHDRVGPAVAGVLRPRIVIPSSLIDLLGRSELAAVMRHESAHLARRDPLLQAGVQLTLALLWPVAPLWIAAHRLRQLVEQACDERALEGSEGSERLAYGEALLAVAAAGPTPVRPALGLLRFGAALRSRLVALRHAGRWPRLVQVVLVAATATLLVAGAGTRPSASAVEQPATKAGLQNPDGEGQWKLSLDLKGRRLHETFGMLRDLGDLELDVADDVPNPPVTLQTEMMTLAEALDLLLKSHGLVGRLKDKRLEVRSPPHEAPELMRVLYEKPLMVEGPDGEAPVALAGTRLVPAGTSLSLGAGALLGLGRSDGGLVVAEGPMSVTLTVETLFVPGVPEESATGRITGTHLLLEGPADPLRVDGQVAGEGPPSRAVPTSIARALAELAEAAVDAAGVEGAPGYMAHGVPTYEEGIVTLEGEFGNKAQLAAYFEAAAAHPRFADVSVGITDPSERGLRFRLVATWVPDPLSQVGMIEIVEELAGRHGVSIEKIMPGRRTDEGAYPLALDSFADREEQASALENALRARFPGATFQMGPLRPRAAGGFDFGTHLVLPPGFEDEPPVPPAPRQVLIEFRIVEFASGVVLPSNWRSVEVDGLPFAAGATEPINTFALDLWIHDAEQRGDARILSAPRIMVQVGEQAEIESGVQVPIESTSATDLDAQVMQVALRVNVTPRETAEGVVSTWRLEVVDPETVLEGQVRAAETGIAVGPVHADGRRIAVWITPTLQGQ